jgi:hypothetical protein
VALTMSQGVTNPIPAYFVSHEAVDTCAAREAACRRFQCGLDDDQFGHVAPSPQSDRCECSLAC